MRRYRPAATAAVLLALLGDGSVARAQPSPPLRLTLDGCASDDESRLRELIALELATFSAEAPARETVVRVACREDRAVITLQDDTAARPFSSELPLRDVSDATRLRLLALSITEMVATRWGEPRAAAPAPATVATDSSPAPAQPRLRLFAAPSLRRIGTPATWLAGMGVGGDYALAPWLALAMGLGFEGGETATSVAAIGWRALTMTAGAAFQVQSGHGRLTWSALPGLAVGLVRLSATPVAPDARGNSLDGLWMGPMLAGRLRSALGRRAFVQLEMAGGLATRQIAGLLNGDAPLVRLQGAWLSASLGAGLTLF